MCIFIYSVNNWGFESKLQNFLNSITVNLNLRLTNLSNATIWHAPLETDHCKASTFRINLHRLIYTLSKSNYFFVITHGNSLFLNPFMTHETTTPKKYTNADRNVAIKNPKPMYFNHITLSSLLKSS